MTGERIEDRLDRHIDAVRARRETPEEAAEGDADSELPDLLRLVQRLRMPPLPVLDAAYRAAGRLDLLQRLGAPLAPVATADAALEPADPTEHRPDPQPPTLSVAAVAGLCSILSLQGCPGDAD